jgi:protoporphyrinogen/coproporphyrinogen III oxidase
VSQFLRSDLLSWRGKLRLACERWVRARNDHSDESVRQFACRRIGREAADVLVDAMVTGIHAGDAELLSVAAAFPRMIQLEQEHGSLFRALSDIRRKRAEGTRSSESLSSNRGNATSTGPGGTLWSLRHGMGQLVERLASDPRLTLIRSVAVDRLEQHADGHWTVYSGSAERWIADAVILACPSFAQAEIVEPIDRDLARLLGEIRYNSVTVVALGFRISDLTAPIDGFGYLIPQRTRSDVLGVLWNSSIFDDRAPPGMVLMQAMCGGWNRPDIITWADDRIVRAVIDELRQTMNLAAQPALVRVIRWPQAIPQYHVGHLDRVASIESHRKRHRRLYITGNSFRGIGVNDCTEESARCASEVLADLVC